MKTGALIVASVALMAVGPAWATETDKASAPPSDRGIVERVEDAVERGVSAAASGVQRGVSAATRGVKTGARAAAHGVGVAASATARAADKTAKAIGLDGAAPPASAAAPN